MSETLRDRLQPYFETTTLFRLPLENALGSADVDGLIRDYLAGALRVEDSNGISGTDPVTWKGRAQLVRTQPEPVDVTVTFATVDGVVQVAVVADALPDAWRLVAAFPDLAETPVADVTFGGAQLTLASSSSPLLGGHLVGLGFAGLPGGPSIDLASWLFEALPRIAGTITLDGSQPQMELVGTTHYRPEPLATLRLIDPGIRVHAKTATPGEAYTYGAGAEAFAKLQFGTDARTVGVEVGLAAGATLMTFATTEPLPLTSYRELDWLGGEDADLGALVSDVPSSSELSLDRIEFSVTPQYTAVAAIGVNVSLRPETGWPLLPSGLLTVKELSVEFAIVRPGSQPSIDAVVGGRFELPGEVEYDVLVDVPDLSVSGSLANDSTIPLDALIRYFLPAATGIPSLEIDRLDIGADPRNGAYSLAIAIATDWPVFETPVLSLRLLDLEFGVEYAPPTTALGLLAGAEVTLGSPATGAKVAFEVSAARGAGDPGWLLALIQSTDTPLDIVEVVKSFYSEGFELPAIVPSSLKIQDVAVTWETATGDYTFAGAIVGTWDLDFVGTTVKVVASVDIEAASPPKLAPNAHAITVAYGDGSTRMVSGTLRGELTIWDFAASVEYRFGEAGDVLRFAFRFRSGEVVCTRTVVKGDVVLRGGLKGVSFGDVLDYLVGLAAPELGFRLAAPWDVLYQLRFDDLELVVNLTQDTVGFSYTLNANLGIVDLKRIGLTYRTNAAGETTVFIEIEGTYLDQNYVDDPLAWDLLNDPPPAPSGNGDTVLELRYLGIGQNVGFAGGRRFDSVADVIHTLEEDFLPPASPDRNPLAAAQGKELVFAGDGRWLIGADFTVMGAVSLSGVFADPSLYGLRIGLSGEKVQSLSGLQFEVLYKKITEAVGVYQIELTLPEAFRQAQFGAVGVTFPIVGLDIFTNGDFRIDFGFPVRRDFTRSFCVQAGPFIGYGGFYLALLDGSTSDRLPVVRNGGFSPVVEFGLGLSLGVGKTIDKGILKAGATLTFESLFEGVVAWFNPDDRGRSTDLYYNVEGTAALVGKLYGSVDFKIVKADVNVRVWAAMTVIVEAHQAIVVSANIGVEVSVSIRIVFVTISFSFATKVDLSFEIGSASRAPWDALALDPAEAPLLLRQQRGRHRHRRLPPSVLYGAIAQRAGGYVLDDTVRALGAAPVGVALQVVPAFTVARPPEGSAGVQMLMVLTARTGADREAPFSALALRVLAWCLTFVKAPPGLGLPRDESTVGVEQLDAVSRLLADREERDRLFAYERVTDFLAANVRLQLSAPWLSGPTAPPPEAGTVFPMPPVLVMRPDKRDDVRFYEHGCVSPAYLDWLQTYYEQLQVDPDAGTGAQPQPVSRAELDAPVPPAAAAGCASPDESLATAVFCDWLALVGKGAVGAARSLLDAFPYRVKGEESLTEIVEQFATEEIEYAVGPGETLGTVAAQFGIGVVELRRLNPDVATVDSRALLPEGIALRVPAGPTVATVAEANADYPLNVNPIRRPVVPVAGAKHQVRLGPTSDRGPITESLSDISRAYGAYGLGGATGLFRPGSAGDANASNGDLLVAGSVLRLPAHTHDVTDADLLGGTPLDRVAARLYVRAGRELTEQQRAWVAWYEQRIADLNEDVAGTIQVPVARLVDGQIAETGTTSYAVADDDTLHAIASAFELVQLEPTTPRYATQLKAKISYTPPIVRATALRLPAWTAVVAPGDSFAKLAARFGLKALDLVLANQSDPGVLRELGVVALPVLDYGVAPGDSLASVAARFDVTLAELAEGASGATAIFAPYGATVGYAHPVGAMSVPHLPSLPREQLEQTLVDDQHVDELAAGAARFMLHGLRVPPPGAPDGAPRGLYEAVGQQFPAPAGPTTSYTVRFEKGQEAPWLTFTGPAGSDHVDVAMGATFMRGQYPATTLDPLIQSGPSAMPVAQEVPPRYGLQHTIHWQSATPVGVPGPTASAAVAGQPSIWPLPDSLVAPLSALAGPTGPYEVVSGPADALIGAREAPLEHYAWATLIPVRVRRVPSSGESGYVLVGAEEAARETLLKAWQWVRQSSSPSTLHLLCAPGDVAPNPSGLASGFVDPARTFVLKANLSTVTSANLAQAADGAYYARWDEPAALLGLVWEASVTGTGGFYLNCSGPAGAGLPAELFAQGDEATIWLLLTLGDQWAAKPDRRLRPFTNCVVVADNVDQSAAALFARPLDVQASRLAQAIPTGTVGFRLSRTSMPPGATGAGATRNVYNLLGYRIEGNGLFATSPDGLPVGPISAVDDDWPGPTTDWRYQQVVPAARFGPAADSPESAALPPPSENPYRGITGPLGAVDLRLAFQDVYGNRTDGSDLAPLSVPFGYIDALIGVAAWPGAAFAYEFTTAGAGVRLDTILSLQADRFLPGPDRSVAQAVEAARNDAARYARAFYQVQQHDLTFALASNLGEATLAAADLKAALTAFVTKVKLFSDVARGLVAVSYAVPPQSDLAEVAQTLASTPALLVAGNADLEAAAVFAAGSVIPRFAIARPTDSLDSLAAEVSPSPAEASSRPERPRLRAVTAGAERAAIPGPPAAAGGDPVQLALDNLATPLAPGLTLRTTPRAQTLPATYDDPLGGDVVNSLNGVAAWLGCATFLEVADPDKPAGQLIAVGLVPENLDRAGLVAPGRVISVGDLAVETGDQTTLGSLFEVFRPVAPTLAAFTAALADHAGLLRPAVAISYATLVVPQPVPGPAGPGTPTFSLASVPAQAGEPAWLAAANRLVRGFYATSAPVYLDEHTVIPAGGETLRELAARHRLSLEQLGAFNRSSLVGEVELTVPGVVDLPGEPGYVGHPASAGESLTTIAVLFGASVDAVAHLNWEVPGSFAAGVTLTIEGKAVPVGALDALAAVYARAATAIPGLTRARFLAALGPIRGVLRSNGAVIVPVPSMPAGKPAQDVAVAFGVASAAADPVAALAALLRANRGLRGFLAPGIDVAGPDGRLVRTGPFDTVDTVVRRFRDEQGVEVDVADVARLNATRANVLAPGRWFLLAPAPTLISSDFVPRLPERPAEPAMFPVEVSIALSRPPALVNPELAQSSEVREAISELTPTALAGERTDAGLGAFAAKFEDAFRGLSLKCAVGKRHGVSVDTQARQVWAVDFGPSGIAEVALNLAEPGFYAVPPLSTALFTGTLGVEHYESGCGLCSARPMRFDGVDVDAWLRDFLGVVDLYLTAPYAVPAFGQQGAGRRSGCGCTGPIGPTAGPGTHDRVVAAKEQIAEEMSRRVVSVLDAPGATAGLPAARETLRQQLLVRLASAYEVDAVVQFPANVRSPYSDPLVAPRLSGAVVQRTPRLPAGTGGLVTLRDAAQVVGVSPAFLAEVVRNWPRLLVAGKTVTYAGRTHEIAVDDTLASIAEAFGIAFEPSQPADWAGWTAFVELAGGIGDAPIVATGTALPVVPIVRPVGPGESLGTVARFTGADVGSVARANQARTGVLVPDAVITIDERRHVVSAADTIWTVAKALAVSVDALAEALRERTDAVARADLRYVTPLPDATVSTAKLALAGGSGVDPQLSFLLTLKGRRERRNLFFSLDYVVSELEHAIAPVPGVTGYQASSWLTFPIPIAGSATTVSQVQVPVPLRAYPDAPMLAAQFGLPTTPDASTIDNAKRWDYGFDVRRAGAAQDVTYAEVRFGPTAMAGPLAAGSDLLSPLATFATAAEQLTNDLAILPALAPGAQDDRAAAAAKVVAYLADRVASGLARWPGARAAASDDALRFQLRTTAVEGRLRELRMGTEDGPGGIADAWPRIFVQSPTGWTGGTAPDEGFLPLALARAQGATAYYDYPAGVPDLVPLTHRLWFDARDVVVEDRGSASVWLTRNHDLIQQGPLGPTGAPGPITTNPAFEYATPSVAFIEPLVPTLGTDQPIDVAKLTPTPRRPLADHLFTLLQVVLELPAAEGKYVQLTCDYAFPAAGPNADLWARQPVRLLPAPEQPITPAGAAWLAGALANSLAGWARAEPRPDGARFELALTLLTRASVAAAGDGLSLKPILRLGRLYLNFQDIEWSSEAPTPTQTGG